MTYQQKVEYLKGYNFKLQRLEHKLKQIKKGDDKGIETCDELRNEIEQIVNTIKAIENEEQKNVLVYRYIEGFTHEKTARIMHYNVRWIKEIHKRAIDNLHLEEKK